MAPNNCLNAKCDINYITKCPGDSQLIMPTPPPGECCTNTPAECQCDMEKCNSFTPECEKGSERILTKKGDGKPGTCCDQFECRPLESKCDNVECPAKFVKDDEQCPEDSYKAPSYVPSGGCCPVFPSCRCKALICAPAQCDEGQKVKIISKGNGTPGQCCDKYECENGDEDQNAVAKKCPHDGVVHENGDIWQSNDCKQCKCKEGIALCSEVNCASPPIECTWVAVPDGECCPVCMGCEADGIRHKRNETWQKDDCTSCACADEGVHHCQKHMCQVNCDNPKKVPGRCCPVCDAPLFMTNPLTCPAMEPCPLRCEYGLLRDAQGCFQCKCAPAVVSSGANCTELTESTCDKFCPHGYDRDYEGCAACKCAKCPTLHQCYKHCLYGFETNAYGCPICKCRVINHNESAYPIAFINDRKNANVCETVSSETGQLVERDSGEWWSDGCRNCFCDQEHEYCSLITCPPRNASCPDDKWKKRDGACCESCLDEPLRIPLKHEHAVCQSMGRLYVDGETWEVSPCTSCTCRIGHVLCRTTECPPLPCSNPVADISDPCCQKCPEDENSKADMLANSNVICKDSKDVVHAVGSSWRVDECQSCRCIADSDGKGRIECFREKCPSLSNCVGIPLNAKGLCCPICSDVFSTSSVCKYNNTVYIINEQWKDGDCRNCTCEAGGQVICRERECPPCNNPEYVSGRCCPTCKGRIKAIFLYSSEDTPINRLYTKPYPTLTQPNNQTSSALSPDSNSLIYGFCVAGIFVLAVFILVLLYKLIKRSQSNQNKKSPIQFNNSSVLISSKTIGSTPRIFEEFSKRRDSCGDGQSESLLSTASESSSAPSSNGSSGHDQHLDTSPLTKQCSGQSKPSDRLTHGFGSFKNALSSKSGDGIGSHL
uniref:Cysteine-rich motor neuron 1 protein n=1 Tax=Syphacia muris TaxID=451379 RepID=A0A0N5AAR7_9BILA